MEPQIVTSFQHYNPFGATISEELFYKEDFTGDDVLLCDDTETETIQLFKPTPLNVIKKELQQAGELGPSAIKSIIKGLRASNVYKGKNTPIK